MYEQTKTQNIKLTGLDNQMVELADDYEEMMRMREEARRRLEARFNDVYSRIKANKDYTIREGKRVNDGLKQFQSKFEGDMKRTDVELTEFYD